ncbi:MAG: hypothetical protein P4L34_12730 [Paludibacter sp.]|nr:hypothetical protein [Paludibacter sp.]
MKVKELFIVLIFVASVSVLFSQNTRRVTTKSVTKKSCFVDLNNNKICDNRENKTCKVCIGNGLGTGRGQCFNGCKNRNSHLNQQGANFVDSNKNGVCDNRETFKK